MSETPLAREIKDLIRQEGPIDVARYMTLALGHPRHGYYITRDPLGAAGDFTTAPEISQMFGEIIGLWAAHRWMILGSPAHINLVELGPGRGTLMADALRAIGKVLPAFAAAIELHLVETSPTLRKAQSNALARSLASRSPIWHEDIATLPDGPLIIIANEFFDALPVHQLVQQSGRWHERLVGLLEGELAFGLAPDPIPANQAPSLSDGALDGTIVEYPEAGSRVMAALSERLARFGGAALIIDYGHIEFGVGDTLQAMAAHAFVDPLARPGEADLTTHVCFETLARIAADKRLAIDILATQAQFLNELGIRPMAANLSRHATPQQAEAIAKALERLTDDAPRAMGSLFKVLAVSAPGTERS
ncbi:class I SAM-dependent methyltransferase [Labrys sp. KNU-23]|uniref:class I SAM-dependent methyltransferase n=1 Tax=Labrys sp. KNU-23 TaxID=2789216 RepID=UPI0011EFCF0D|nr:SAM-dependent methyltransferase [Labrys sp. KNU-23]QEN90023.1 class I SAM-dependent methyltransferase [Labrys sp. KNU-23]